MNKVHFLNVGCADTTIIESKQDIIMIDCYDIESYKTLLPSNKKILAVFITHQHNDHFLGLEYLKTNGYIIERIYYSPYERRWGDNSVTADEWQNFNSLLNYFISKGTIAHKPFRQTSFSAPFTVLAGLKIWMLGPFSFLVNDEKREIHDSCLVFTVGFPNYNCCFTGDASDKLLEPIATLTDNYCNGILHASHHGSINGATQAFIKKAGAFKTIISTKEGVYPSVPDSEAIKRYSSVSNTIWRTDINGSLHIDF
jgi:beta-lactamase superfamily II metal-dependent hydrolase